MKKVLALVTTLALALPVAALAQGKVDWSGTYTFDEAKSDPAPAGRGGGGGGGGRGGGGTPSKLVLKQAAGALTIDRTTANGTDTLVYKLDGTESVNKMGMGEAKSKVTFEGGNLVITSKQAVQTPAGNMEIDVKEVYTVAGNVLTIQTTRTTARGETSRKLVYNKG